MGYDLDLSAPVSNLRLNLDLRTPSLLNLYLDLRTPSLLINIRNIPRGYIFFPLSPPFYPFAFGFI
ncbi:uncharacterized protein K441DRAFT_665217 [Cenococcum geophilum 1.58]|uniref:uncharacterized protein n=1 Tax=Cenococcum geophilum 1.58 TaxID=794803 RepID=UPI00358E3EAC|nr:hypothetical protein K441DRAFT_665217 [Cenococcum geophilum 1.58]